MPQNSKRRLSTTSRSISPPKVKRRLASDHKEPVKVSRSAEDGVRVFSWNVNGIKVLLQKKLSFQPNTVAPLRAFLKRHKWPELLCMQEVKINSSDVATQREVGRAANAGSISDEPGYIVTFSLPRDKYNATGFGGKVHGVATLIREDLTKDLISTERPDWDLEGRVLVHHFNFDKRALIIINGYWVNGTSNPYRNTITGEVEGTRHDHKLRFHAHILRDVLQLEEQGNHVVLVGDMNVAPTRIDGHPNLRTSPVQHVTNRADFNQKFFLNQDGLRGVDVFRRMHRDTKKYTYHPRGIGWGQSCDRVDNIIVTKELFAVGAVLATDICDNPLDRGHSDHVPLWVDLDPSCLPMSAALGPAKPAD